MSHNENTHQRTAASTTSLLHSLEAEVPLDEIEKEISGIIGGIEHSLDELEKNKTAPLSRSGEHTGHDSPAPEADAVADESTPTVDSEAKKEAATPDRDPEHSEQDPTSHDSHSNTSTQPSPHANPSPSASHAHAIVHASDGTPPSQPSPQALVPSRPSSRGHDVPRRQNSSEHQGRSLNLDNLSPSTSHPHMRPMSARPNLESVVGLHSSLGKGADKPKHGVLTHSNSRKDLPPVPQRERPGDLTDSARLARERADHARDNEDLSPRKDLDSYQPDEALAMLWNRHQQIQLQINHLLKEQAEVSAAITKKLSDKLGVTTIPLSGPLSPSTSASDIPIPLSPRTRSESRSKLSIFNLKSGKPGVPSATPTQSPSKTLPDAVPKIDSARKSARDAPDSERAMEDSSTLTPRVEGSHGVYSIEKPQSDPSTHSNEDKPGTNASTSSGSKNRERPPDLKRTKSGTLPRSMIQKGFTEQAEEDKEREEREKLEAKIAKEKKKEERKEKEEKTKVTRKKEKDDKREKEKEDRKEKESKKKDHTDEKDSLQSANTRESKSNVPKSAEKKGRFNLLGYGDKQGKPEDGKPHVASQDAKVEENDGEIMDKLNVKNKLGLFFARQKQEEKGSVKPEDWIPALDERIITACCNRLSEGLETAGLFRIPGAHSGVERIYTYFKSEEKVAQLDDLLQAEDNFHNVAGVLKQYLRNIRPPIIPYASFNSWMDASTKFSKSDQKDVDCVTILQVELYKLDCVSSLKILFKFLISLAALSDLNKMDKYNIGIVFGPTVFKQDPALETPMSSLSYSTKSSDLIVYFMDYYDKIFK